MNLHSLNPRPSEFVIDGVAYTISPFNLRVMEWIAAEFSNAEADLPPNGLSNFESLVNDYKNRFDAFENAVCDVVYFMMEDKDTFPSPCIFKKAVKDSRAGATSSLASLFVALCDAMGNSQPEYSEAELEIEKAELKKKVEALQNEITGLKALLKLSRTS